MKEEAGGAAALSLCSGFLSCKQVLPSRAFHLQLCFGRPRRELQTKVHSGLSVGPSWAGASPVISNTLSGFPQTPSVLERGSAHRQPCQCLEIWYPVDKIQERKHIKIDTVAFLLCESCFAMVSNPSLNVYQTSKTLTNCLQVLHAQMDLKLGIIAVK